MNRKQIVSGTMSLLCSALIFASCGKVEDKVTEIKNDQRIKGNWLLTSSENGGAVQNAVEKESIVLTFKDDKAAFSPVSDSVKAKAIFTALHRCTVGPRPYKTDKNLLVFDAVAGCDQKQVTVQTLDDSTLKFPDPNTPEVVRVFKKITDETYQALVKPADRRL